MSVFVRSIKIICTFSHYITRGSRFRRRQGEEKEARFCGVVRINISSSVNKTVIFVGAGV